MQDIRRGGDVTWSRESAMIDMSLVEHPVFHKTSESQASQALGLRGRKEDRPVPSDREDRFLGDAEVCGFFRRLLPVRLFEISDARGGIGLKSRDFCCSHDGRRRETCPLEIRDRNISGPAPVDIVVRAGLCRGKGL